MRIFSLEFCCCGFVGFVYATAIMSLIQVSLDYDSRMPHVNNIINGLEKTMHYFCFETVGISISEASFNVWASGSNLYIYHTKHRPTVNLSRLSDTDSMSRKIAGFPSSSFFI